MKWSKKDGFYNPCRCLGLSNVLSKEEIKGILQAPSNLKHRAMLSIIYTCGLRRSELLNLKPGDIDRQRGVLLIRQSKGKKDRIEPISDKIIKLLEECWISYRTKSPYEDLFIIKNREIRTDVLQGYTREMVVYP